MNKDFDKMVNKVIKAIKEIEPGNRMEDIHKKCILYAIIKMCESEELFTENLLILDKYASNGAEHTKKLKR